MITWPVAAKQFYNEKLVIEVIKIGVPVGVKKWTYFEVEGCIKWDVVQKAVKMVLAKEEAKGMRNTARVLAKMARQAVEEGGSSSQIWML